jgi:plastocyanin
MKRFSCLALFLTAAALTSGTALAEATVEGKVALPKPRVTVANKRYAIAAKGGMAPVNPTLAVVYLEGNFPAPTGTATAQLVQKDMAFSPRLLPIQVGTRVEFPNQDDIEHSVYTSSSPKSFNLGRIEPSQRPVPSQVFDQPGLFTIRCDIHENMRADILVLATPHFIVTDADGNYRLNGLPAGHHVLKVWCEGKTQEHAVDLTDGAVAKVDLP